ncbi:MAG: hypothetical protein HY788_08560 [Deltaproteobacteria bacterium]|nr:hypothetical protein [Deltaproteobacteria bacterium]
MAVAFDSTFGGTSANSYISVEEADDYFAMRVHTDAWANAAIGGKQKALMDATRRLDRIEYTGDKTSGGQALEWPRTGATLRDETIDHDEIPVRMLDAVCELALAVLNSNIDPCMPESVQSFSVGGVSVALSGPPSSTFPPEVDRLIAPLRFMPKGNVVLKRG